MLARLDGKSPRLAATLLATALVLSGCGGGDGSGRTSPPPPAAVIVGSAALDGALAGQQVTLADAKGRTLGTTTGSDGGFSVPAEGIAYPALVRIDVASATDAQARHLYAVLDAAPSGQVFVTPLSTAVVGALAQGDAATLFDTVGSSATTRDALATARIDNVETALRADAAALARGDEAKGWLATSGRITALPASLQLPTVADLIRQVGQALTLNSLGLSAAAAVASLPIGCDAAGMTLLHDGTPRPACAGGANYPVSRSIAGALKPVAMEHPGDAAAWADMLAGVGGPNWKLRDPKATSEALQPALRARLKSLVSDLWSGDTGASFPESFAIDQGSVTDLVTSIRDVSWHRLGSGLTAGDVSNTAYAYQALAAILADASARDRLFFPLPADAVRLAAPTAADHGEEATLEGFGPDIESFARQWLGETANQDMGTPDPAVTAVFDADTAFIDRVASPPFATVVEDARALNGQLLAAIGRLPASANGLAGPARDMGDWWVDFAQNCVYPSSLPYPQGSEFDARCSDVAARQNDVLSRFANAFLDAQRASAGAPETAGAFYQRFLDALARHITQSYEQDFASHVDASELVGSIGYTPVVVAVELHDNGAYTGCCLSSAEMAAPRSALVYHADGQAMRFAVDANGAADTFTTTEVPLLMRSFVAPPLTSLSFDRIDGPFEVPYSSLAAIAIGCSQADTACMQRLARSRVSGATTQGTGPTYLFGLSLLDDRIAANGGIAGSSQMTFVNGP